jgi:hypothetical protein
MREILEGPSFSRQQIALARFNRRRLQPSLGDPFWRMSIADDVKELEREAEFVEAARREVAPWLADVPTDAGDFVAWFEALRETGPGQGDPLFPYLADHATAEEMRWFLTQEVAGEAGFDDLVAMTQVKMPVRAKLEMARNYWDEMGRGQTKGMHGPMLERLAAHLDLAPTHESTITESLALANMMVAFAANRRYAFQAVGALGAIELTAPTRAGYVHRGLRRLGVPDKASHYFALHAVLDVKHAAAWNEEVLHTLVEEDRRRARPIAEGAILRLWCGKRCFARYREVLGLTTRSHAA